MWQKVLAPCATAAHSPNCFLQLTLDPTTRQYMNDPAFVNKLKLLQQSPQMMNSLLQTDPRLQQALGVLLGIGAGFVSSCNCVQFGDCLFVLESGRWW